MKNVKNNWIGAEHNTTFTVIICATRYSITLKGLHIPKLNQGPRGKHGPMGNLLDICSEHYGTAEMNLSGVVSCSRRQQRITEQVSVTAD